MAKRVYRCYGYTGGIATCQCPTDPYGNIYVNGTCVFVNGVARCCASGCVGCTGCTTSANCTGPCPSGSTPFCSNE
ncbi:unnamed protein product [Rotaria sp. Silwood1]|nr:unnamed protein product [Rotaria sp. Silwood1]CAF4863416.1 unnamed protein product [Rotaria sp. Silwood1]